jgi:hypothetical protein
VNSRSFSIGKNPNPASIKFSGTTTYESWLLYISIYT